MSKEAKQIETQDEQSLLHDERGLTTIEYIIVLCLIAIVGFAVWQAVGATVAEKAGEADTTLGMLSGSSAVMGGASTGGGGSM